MPVFLFTDIEGSTRIWEKLADVMGDIIARHDDILQETIASAGGRITKHTGDGVTAALEGGQKTGDTYQALLKEHGFRISMNGVGTWYNNAPMDSFLGTLKSELVSQRVYRTRSEARTGVFFCIEVF